MAGKKRNQMIRELILSIYNYLGSTFNSREANIVILASLPIIEARYAIPIAYVLMRESLIKIFILAVIGNMLPVIPLLLLFKPVSNKLRRFKLWRNFFDRLTKRTKKKAYLIEKYEALGLILFVSVPLPITGAWTGCIAANIFKIRFRYALLAIFIGVIISASIISILTILGKDLFWLKQYHF